MQEPKSKLKSSKTISKGLHKFIATGGKPKSYKSASANTRVVGKK